MQMRLRVRSVCFACAALMVLAACCSCGVAQTTAVEASASPAQNGEPPVWTTEHDARDNVRVVLHLPQSLQPAVHTMRSDRAAVQQLMRVQVGSAPDPNRAAILGRVDVTDDTLTFTPQFPFRSGMTYCAEFHPPLRTPGTAQGKITEAAAIAPYVFTVTREEPSVPTEVTAIYPSADVLPENLLRFYVHFSRPMRRGAVYDHVRVVNEQGQAVDLPFLEIAEELWSTDRRRITLLFDPGRIKRGLKPREEHGPILQEGGRYTLEIDAEWPDAFGQPLKAPVRKTFTVTAPDDTQPAPKRWSVVAPKAGTRDPLSVGFDESLDHAMLHRVIDVRAGDQSLVSGSIAIADHERRWQFTPSHPWSPGTYALRVATILEDVAGNSIQRPFEVDVFREIQEQTIEEHVTVPFTIESAADH